MDAENINQKPVHAGHSAKPAEFRLSIIIPAKNEAASLPSLIARVSDLYRSAEIIIVNDGSTDATNRLKMPANVRVLSLPYCMGNGAAIKNGARAAQGEILAFLDADSQHNPEDIARLLTKLQEGYDMVVGGRSGSSQASVGRWFANKVYNRLASWMVGQRIEDLTSGLRVARADKFREFLYLLPNGFSYPTTITMSFFRAGYSVAYVPIVTGNRIGKSHIRLRDVGRFFIIIFRVGTLYSPLKLFLPVSLFFFLVGITYYAYTFITLSRFTNMSALLFIASMLTLLIGIVSEQVAALHHKGRDEPANRPENRD